LISRERGVVPPEVIIDPYTDAAAARYICIDVYEGLTESLITRRA